MYAYNYRNLALLHLRQHKIANCCSSINTIANSTITHQYKNLRRDGAHDNHKLSQWISVIIITPLILYCTLLFVAALYNSMSVMTNVVSKSIFQLPMF